MTGGSGAALGALGRARAGGGARASLSPQHCSRCPRNRCRDGSHRSRGVAFADLVSVWNLEYVYNLARVDRGRVSKVRVDIVCSLRYTTRLKQGDRRSTPNVIVISYLVFSSSH